MPAQSRNSQLAPVPVAPTPQIRWPLSDTKFMSFLSELDQKEHIPTPQANQEAVILLEKWASEVDPDCGNPMDIGVFDFWPRTGIQDSPVQQFIGARVVTLYYRQRSQLCILEVFMALIRKGLVSLKALRKPWQAWSGEQNSNVMSQRLMVFEEGHRETEIKVPEEEPHVYWENDTATLALEWLATMIIRGSKDVNEVIEEIENSGMMGGRNETAWQDYQTRCADQEVVCNSEERVAHGGPEPPFFGFWLPHGLENMSEKEIRRSIDKHLEDFRRTETVFRGYFKFFE